jgi:hypothetical protein
MNLNDMPITMDDPATNPHTPPHAVHPTLIDTLLSQFTAHIDMLVETKFYALVQTRNTLTLLDVEMKKEIADMIETAIESHEGRDAHFDRETIEEISADQARETLSEYAERQEGWVTKDQVNDLITEHVDEELDRIDWEEKVKDVLRDML